MHPNSSVGSNPETPDRRPAAFWWLVWLVLFLVVFNLVMFAKFVVGSSRKEPGSFAGEATNGGPAAVTQTNR